MTDMNFLLFLQTPLQDPQKILIIVIIIRTRVIIIIILIIIMTRMERICRAIGPLRCRTVQYEQLVQVFHIHISVWQLTNISATPPPPLKLFHMLPANSKPYTYVYAVECRKGCSPY